MSGPGPAASREIVAYQRSLQQHVKERAQEELLKLRKIHQRWNELKTAVGVQESRVKRGLVDGGGRVLNWLFEVSTQEDLEHVNGWINKLSTEITSIVHALEVYASLINETLWETKASGEAVAELQTAFARIEREAWKMDNKMDGVMKEIERQWIATTQVGDAFCQIGSAVGWIKEVMDNFAVKLAAMAMERLPATLFPPLQVQAALKEIKSVLPSGWSLSPSIQKGDVWKVYTEAKVIVATDEARSHTQCTTHVSPWLGQQTVYLGHRRWGYSTTEDTTITITCPQSREKVNTLIRRKPFDVFEVPMSCTAHTENWTFQASFRKNVKYALNNASLPSLTELEKVGQV
ncbi:hypothetical protein OUZ56_029939 [Daphnia magna]|uniref:Uncharacterized protein n=1 Tax=Daphnia magna TaxID=35525 RepID=A0ABR0B8B4_9CRUS|nr:hypothetical protein OUZ56_029939 [Daphnia magna]